MDFEKVIKTIFLKSGHRFFAFIYSDDDRLNSSVFIESHCTMYTLCNLCELDGPIIFFKETLSFISAMSALLKYKINL